MFNKGQKKNVSSTADVQRLRKRKKLKEKKKDEHFKKSVDD